MTGLCLCGCGEKTTIARRNDPSKGWVKGQPVRFRPGHMHRMPRPWQRKEQSREEDRGYLTPCRVWLLSKSEDGYGRLDGRMAHKVIWERTHGPVPDGLTLDHLCRQRDCIREDHLEPVTFVVNLHRGAGTKLTDLEVAHLREMARLAPTPFVAGLFSISEGHARKLVSGRARPDFLAKAA